MCWDCTRRKASASRDPLKKSEVLVEPPFYLVVRSSIAFATNPFSTIIAQLRSLCKRDLLSHLPARRSLQRPIPSGIPRRPVVARHRHQPCRTQPASSLRRSGASPSLRPDRPFSYARAAALTRPWSKTRLAHRRGEPGSSAHDYLTTPRSRTQGDSAVALSPGQAATDRTP